MSVQVCVSECMSVCECVDSRITSSTGVLLGNQFSYLLLLRHAVLNYLQKKVLFTAHLVLLGRRYSILAVKSILMQFSIYLCSLLSASHV